MIDILPGMDIKEKKKKLRKEIIARRDSLSDLERDAASKRIRESLFGLSEFKNAKSVHFFISFGSEVITTGMIRDAIKMGKKVVVPFIDRDKKMLRLSELRDFDKELESGYWGIQEPKKECMREVVIDDVELMVMPGVAFDGKGHRLGYGMAFYDKLIAGRKVTMPLVAITFDMQVVDDVPVAGHDVLIDKIVTEKRVIVKGEVKG
ncbi:MAG: 5-formyltetrahydrofolate cyclo-ligase [Nitrospirota bacterium]|jgi:5-formyltetrahydrofolate cyclo-ligase